MESVVAVEENFVVEDRLGDTQTYRRGRSYRHTVTSHSGGLLIGRQGAAGREDKSAGSKIAN